MTTINLDPSENIASIVASSAAGTTFMLASGVYNDVSITPKNGDFFIGVGNVTLTGSTPITGWTQSGNYWVAAGFPSPGYSVGTADVGRDGLAQVPEDLYVNGTHYLRVGSLSALGPGEFYSSGGNVYISDNPTGKVTTASLQYSAFNGDNTSNVTIQNLSVTQYASYAQHGAIELHGSTGWTLTNVNAYENHGAGLEAGSNMTVTGGNYGSNGQVGIEDWASSNLVINGVTANNNNWAGFAPTWDAGGMKFIGMNGVTLENSQVSNNHGDGIWFDTNNQNVNVLNDQIEYNWDLGIEYEASFKSTFSGNNLSYNAQSGYTAGYWGAGLFLQDSQDATVTNNLVIVSTANGEGIGEEADSAAVRPPGALGPYGVQNNVVEHNTFVLLVPAINGAAGDGAANDTTFDGTNVWDYNTYISTSPQLVNFTWNGTNYWAVGLTNPPIDSHGTFTYVSNPLSYIAPNVSLAVNGTAAPGSVSVSSGAVTLSGAASGISAVTVGVYDGSTLLGTATPNASGAWSYSTTLGGGSHTLHVVATDTYSDATTTASVPVTVSGTGTTGPAISSVAYSTTSNVAVGGTVQITVGFNQAVNLSGSGAALILNDGGIGTYSSGSGTSSLVFSYTVAAGQYRPTLSVTSLNLNGTSLTNSAGTSASLSLSGIAQNGPMIAGGTPAAATPAITSIAYSTTSNVAVGGTVKITVGFNQAVNLSGSGAALILNDGGIGTYSSGSGTSSLVFSYTVAAGQYRPALSVTSLNLNGTTLTNSAGTSASLSLSGISQSGPMIAGGTPAAATPAITSIAYSTTSNVAVGGTVRITVGFNQAVNLSGSGAALILNDGGIGTYSSGSGTSSLVFSYTVAAGQYRPALSVTSLNLNGTTLTNSAGTTASLSLSGIAQNGPMIAGGTAAAATPAMVASVNLAAAAAPSATHAGSGTYTVASYIANPAGADGQSGGFSIVDTAANVNANIDALNADSHLGSIALTGASTQTLTLTIAQAMGDTNALDAISSAFAMTVNDTAANVDALMASQIATLESHGVDRIDVADAETALTAAQKKALGAANIALQQPSSGGVVEALEYDANGTQRSVTYAGIAGEAYTSYTEIYGADGKPTSASYDDGMKSVWAYNADGSYEISSTGVQGETYSSSQSIVSQYDTALALDQDMSHGPSVLRLSSSDLTVSTDSSGLSVTGAADTFKLAPNASQTIDATGTNSDAFIFAPNFWTDTIHGFATNGASHDVIQLNVSSFSYLTSGTSQAQDLATVLSHSQSVGGNLVIADSAHDTLTLVGVAASTLAANPSDFRFK